MTAAVSTTITYTDAHSRVQKMQLRDGDGWESADGLLRISRLPRGRGVDPGITYIPLSRVIRIDAKRVTP